MNEKKKESILNNLRRRNKSKKKKKNRRRKNKKKKIEKPSEGFAVFRRNFISRDKSDPNGRSHQNEEKKRHIIANKHQTIEKGKGDKIVKYQELGNEEMITAKIPRKEFEWFLKDCETNVLDEGWERGCIFCMTVKMKRMIEIGLKKGEVTEREVIDCLRKWHIEAPYSEIPFYGSQNICHFLCSQKKLYLEILSFLVRESQGKEEIMNRFDNNNDTPLMLLAKNHDVKTLKMFWEKNSNLFFLKGQERFFQIHFRAILLQSKDKILKKFVQMVGFKMVDVCCVDIDIDISRKVDGKWDGRESSLFHSAILYSSIQTIKVLLDFGMKFYFPIRELHGGFFMPLHFLCLRNAPMSEKAEIFKYCCLKVEENVISFDNWLDFFVGCRVFVTDEIDERLIIEMLRILFDRRLLDSNRMRPNKDESILRVFSGTPFNGLTKMLKIVRFLIQNGSDVNFRGSCNCDKLDCHFVGRNVFELFCRWESRDWKKMIELLMPKRPIILFEHLERDIKDGIRYSKEIMEYLEKNFPKKAGKCSFCWKKGMNFKICGRCRICKYCSVKCQKKHWKSCHRAQCKPPNLRKKKCGFCFRVRNNGDQFKRCSLCQKVRYCSEKCQNRHWLKHKKECGMLKNPENKV